MDIWIYPDSQRWNPVGGINGSVVSSRTSASLIHVVARYILRWVGAKIAVEAKKSFVVVVKRHCRGFRLLLAPTAQISIQRVLCFS